MYPRLLHQETMQPARKGGPNSRRVEACLELTAGKVVQTDQEKIPECLRWKSYTTN